MEDKIVLRKEKFEEMTERLKYLETNGRIEIALAIKTAKEYGDLSENAEYTAAKDAQVAMEYEILALSETLLKASILNENNITTTEVSLGNIVKVYDEEFDEEVEYTIVSSAEAQSRENKISNVSPLGKALIGHKKGAKVSVTTPGGILKLKIIEIKK